MPTIDDTLLIPVLGEGDKLYHYTSAAGMQGICGGEFWITESNFLNDSTEFKIATDIFCEVMDSKVTNTDVRDKLKVKVCEEIQRFRYCPAVGEDIAYSGDYVISFSLDYDSTLMWSEYSNFLGYCLKFDFEKLYNGFDNFCAIQHGKVIYNHDEQMNLIERTIEKEVIDWNSEFDYIKSWEGFDNLTDENIDDLYTYLAVIIEAYNQFFKLPCFEGEHEYRFIFFCGHEGGRFRPEQLDKQHFRVKDEVLIPFVKKKVTLDGLEEVLVGPKNKSDIAVLGVERFLRNQGLSVPVVKSKMPLRY